MHTSEMEKRTGLRVNLESVAGLRIDGVVNAVYAIDISSGGIKIGRPQLCLNLGAPVEVFIEKHGARHQFPGRVLRADGSHFVNRLKCSVSAYFVEISDDGYRKFLHENYFI